MITLGELTDVLDIETTDVILINIDEPDNILFNGPLTEAFNFIYKNRLSELRVIRVKPEAEDFLTVEFRMY